MIEGLPERWKAVAYRFGKFGESCLFNGKVVTNSFSKTEHPVLIVEKIQPRRMAFDEITDGTQAIVADYYIKYKWWREVRESDIPLNSEDPKLSLSVAELIDASKRTWPDYLEVKIEKFIKENS